MGTSKAFILGKTLATADDLNGKANTSHTHSVNDITDISSKRQLPFDIEWQIHDQFNISGFSVTGNAQLIKKVKGFTQSDLSYADAIYICIYNISCSTSEYHNSGLTFQVTAYNGSNYNRAILSISNEYRLGYYVSPNVSVLGFRSSVYTNNTYNITEIGYNAMANYSDYNAPLIIPYESYNRKSELQIVSTTGVYSISFDFIFKIGRIVNFV